MGKAKETSFLRIDNAFFSSRVTLLARSLAAESGTPLTNIKFRRRETFGLLVRYKTYFEVLVEFVVNVEEAHVSVFFHFLVKKLRIFNFKLK